MDYKELRKKVNDLSENNELNFNSKATLINFINKEEINQFAIPVVSNRRELLIDFMKFMYKNHWEKSETVIKQKIDEYVKGNK